MSSPSLCTLEMLRCPRWLACWWRVRLSAGAIRGAQDKDGAGLTFSKQATSKSGTAVTLERSRTRTKRTIPVVQMNLGQHICQAGGDEIGSNDAPEKIAEFYRRRWRIRRGIDCSEPSQKPSAKDSNKLDCGDDKPEKGGLCLRRDEREAAPRGNPSKWARESPPAGVCRARGDEKDKKRFETHFLSPSGRAKATFRGVRRHHREGRSPGDLGGRAKLLFGLAFRQGILGCPSGGSREASRASQTAARNPRFEKVKFAPYSACVIDRSIPGEHAAVRRSIFRKKKKVNKFHQRGEYSGAGQDSLR